MISLMRIYAFTIFISAWLLFAVQPMMGKFILPLFGGGSSVWTIVLLFFQLILLAGYSYSYLLTRTTSVSRQWKIHVTLLCISLLFLPVIPGSKWKPTFNEDPTFQILLLLMATIGLPYFLLSTTGPLLQHWFVKNFPEKSPYPLYVLSNIASLLALLSYPFLIKPTDSILRL